MMTMQAGTKAAVVAGVGLLGFAAGRWSGAAGVTQNDTRINQVARYTGADGPALSRKRERAAAGSLVEEARMPVPVAKVEELLIGMVGRKRFEFMDTGLDEALALLGVTEEEAMAVRAAVEEMQRNMLQVEREAAVVKEQTATRVTLDLTAVHDRLDGVRAELEQGLRGALPAEKAELLAGCIQWKSFYTPVNFLEEVKFEIHRDARSKHLRPVVWLLGGWDGRGVLPPTYADDGSAIPAGEVFDRRWAKLMEGRTLVPVDGE